MGYPASYVYELIDEGFDPFDYATAMRLFQYNPVKEDAKWTHKLQVLFLFNYFILFNLLFVFNNK